MLVRARELEFDVHIGGPAGGEPVLLLHGFPQHSGQWHKVVAPLHEAGLRTIAVDQRGYSPGARPTDAADYVVPECIADAVSIMDELGVPAFHVVGHDWGAAVAWGLAGNHPELVKSLVAISVPHPAAMSAALRTDSEQKEMSSYIGLFAQVDKAEQLLLDDDAATLRGLFAGSGMSDSEVEIYVRPMQEPGALRGALSWYAALRQHGLGSVGPVTVPTTYIWGEEDIALGKTGALATEDHVSASYRFVALQGISHWVPDQAPEVVAAEIIARVTSAQ